MAIRNEHAREHHSMKRILILVVGICGFGLANAQEDSFFSE